MQPWLTQEILYSLGQRCTGQHALLQLGQRAAARQLQFFLAALGFGGAAFGNFHTAAMLRQEVAELFFQGEEDRQVLVEFGH